MRLGIRNDSNTSLIGLQVAWPFVPNDASRCACDNQVQVQELPQPRHLRGLPRALGQRQGLHGKRARQAADISRPKGPRLLHPQGARVQALVKTAGPTQKSEKKLKVSTRTLRGCSHSRDSRAQTNRHQFLYRRPSRRLAQPSCNPGDD